MNTVKARRDMPGYTCPDIDALIAGLESLRQDNNQLRYTAEDALDFADKETDRADNAERRIEELEDRVNDLERLLSEARP